VPPLEAWERVLINQDRFLNTMHGNFGCITCHGGVPGESEMELAHAGISSSAQANEACFLCHIEIAETNASSLHTTLEGYRTVIYQRGSPETVPQLEEMMEDHCYKCHTTCGQCHIIRPTNLEGGLVSGHEFRRIPPMNLTCTGCHGSRVNDEYKGENPGVPADVHWRRGGMPCFACHSQDQMHGALGEKDHRYDGPPTPGCRDCHSDVQAGTGNPQHSQVHLERLACAVCHSTTYKTCYGCHVQVSPEGEPFYRLEKSEMDFKIGLNPRQGPDRPWTYVPVRHVPIARNVFDYYGENLLPNFDTLPTWAYATPHNIQRNTPQTETCLSCHDNPDVFLTEDDVLPDELEANRDVIVRQVPSLR